MIESAFALPFLATSFSWYFFPGSWLRRNRTAASLNALGKDMPVQVGMSDLVVRTPRTQELQGDRHILAE